MSGFLSYLQSDSFLFAFLSYRYYVEILAIGCAILIEISSVDDVFVDLYYWGLKILGNKHERARARDLDIATIDFVAERPFAIMVPAWKEFEVIFSMLTANSRLLRYQNYQFFVGVYRNDPRTIRYGGGENLYGYKQIEAFRAARSPVGLARTISKTVITTYGRDTAVASTLFYRDTAPGKVGRQMQTWVRFPEGWKIVAAHVSIIDEPRVQAT